jgi:phospholipase/carboxylesterase
MGHGGRAWWRVDIERLVAAGERGDRDELAREVPPGLSEAHAQVVAMLGDLGDRLKPSRVVLGGFSQGAMLACDVALRTSLPLAGVALLSGTLVARDEWGPLAASRRGLPFFQSHGTEDPILPFAQAEKLRDLLREGGAEVTWVPFRGGHAIPGPVTDGLGKWLRGARAPAT